MGAAVEKAGEEQGLDPIFRTGSRRSAARRGGCLLIDLFSLLFFLRPWQRGSCRYGDCLLRVPPLSASPPLLPPPPGCSRGGLLGLKVPVDGPRWGGEVTGSAWHGAGQLLGR